MSPSESPAPQLTESVEEALFREEDVVFNIVWTGGVFEYLQVFCLSLMDHSRARFRFVANACSPDQIVAMERMAARLPDRIVGVVEVSPHVMVGHGVSLDRVLAAHDDGDFFCFIDADILATGSFMPLFLGTLQEVDAVTSGREVWASTNVRPADHIGVNGEYFFDQDGFVFGSPHLALYKREPLLETMDRWAIGFGSAGGSDLSEAVRERLKEIGRDYWIYDTAKLVNILMQADGRSLAHVEHPDLMHIGGVSHFLAPPKPVTEDGRPRPARWGETPDWGGWDGMADRYAVSSYTGQVLRDLVGGQSPPGLPDDIAPELADKLTLVRGALLDLVSNYGAQSEFSGAHR